MVLRQVTPLTLVAAMLLARSARAEAPCFAAFTDGQRAAASGNVLEARARFEACVADSTCPAAPLVSDCATQLDEATARVGSIVVSLSDGSTTGHVSIDGVEVARAIDGKAVELNPGVHRVVVSVPGSRLVTDDVLVAEGAKLKQIIVDMQPHVLEPIPEALKPTKPNVPAWLTGGVAVAGGLGFGVLAGVGQATYDACPAAGCTSNTLSTLRTERVVALTFLGVGVLSLAATLVMIKVKF